jgi:hypothetical protein
MRSCCQLPTRRDPSAGVGARVYERHDPERTLLYQLVKAYCAACLSHQVAEGAELPKYVEQEFEDYLKCGHVTYGFLRLRCDTCHAKHLMAFSCYLELETIQSNGLSGDLVK